MELGEMWFSLIKKHRTELHAVVKATAHGRRILRDAQPGKVCEVE